MGRWSRQMAPLLIEFAAVEAAGALLDIGCGVGSLAVALEAAFPDSMVCGIDPVASFVDAARARSSGARAEFAVGDARNLPFADDTFDASLSLLVMNFVPEPDLAVSEAIRVTRPGGVVAAAVWDYGEGMEMLRAFWDAAGSRTEEATVPLTRPGGLGELWRGNGLDQIQEEPLTIEQGFASFDDYWEPFLGGQGPAGTFVTSLPAARREALRWQLRARFVGRGEDRPFRLEARAWAVRGMVPQTQK